jgi:hypothetical protein
MATCRGVLTPTLDDIKPGIVLHDEKCEREWLVLSDIIAKTWNREGVYPALYFDKDHRGEGVNAVLLGQEVITLHISTQGLIMRVPK